MLSFTIQGSSKHRLEQKIRRFVFGLLLEGLSNQVGDNKSSKT
jgi:hypothetical protein